MIHFNTSLILDYGNVSLAKGYKVEVVPSAYLKYAAGGADRRSVSSPLKAYLDFLTRPILYDTIMFSKPFIAYHVVKV